MQQRPGTYRVAMIVVAGLIATVALFMTASSAQAPLLDGQEVATTDFHGTAPDPTAAVGPVNSPDRAGG
jgi:hypothetical protein